MLITEALYEEESIKIVGEFITTIRYADDISVVATTAEDLQRIMKKIQNTCTIYSLNAKQTKTMKISKTKMYNKILITVNEEVLEQVEEYLYLRCTFDENDRCIKVQKRIGMD